MINRICSMFLGLSLLCLFTASCLAAAEKQARACLSIGDTATVTGHIEPGVNGGTYFVPLKQFCVYYPKRTDRFVPRSVEIIGDKLPPSIYVEVVGELSDPWPVEGIGFKVKTFRNVDLEVRAQLAEWKRGCEQWQDKNSARLSEQTHGGQIAHITGDEFSDAPGHRCGIWAADMKLPHDVITIWRPEP